MNSCSWIETARESLRLAPNRLHLDRDAAAAKFRVNRVAGRGEDGVGGQFHNPAVFQNDVVTTRR